MRALAAMLLACALLWSGVANANAGLPMLLVIWPLAFAGIIPVIAVEAWVVRRGTGVSWRVSLWEMTKANLVSTLVGLPLTWIALVALEFLAAYLLVGVAKAQSFPPGWRRVVWRANLVSYGILFVATLIWLLAGLAANDWSGDATRLG
jgi:hypothetical protein